MEFICKEGNKSEKGQGKGSDGLGKPWNNYFYFFSSIELANTILDKTLPYVEHYVKI